MVRQRHERGFPSIGDCDCPLGIEFEMVQGARYEFIELVKHIREQILASLQEAADCKIGYREKTPLSKTVRTCRQLLKVESAI